MSKVKNNLPNLITLISLFLGFSSILSCLQAVQDLLLHERLNSLDANPERFLSLAGFFIIFGGVLDMFDGGLARLLKVDNPIGKHLDSLADLVTFGIAPGVLFYTICLFAGESIPESGIVYYIPNFIPDFFIHNLFMVKILAFFFPITSVIRLARFNEMESKNYFIGIPSTSSGGFVALIFTFNFYHTPMKKILEDFELIQFSFFTELAEAFKVLFNNFLFLLLVYLFMSLLMISPIRFVKFKYYLYRLPKKIKKIILYVFPFFIILYFKYTLLVMAGFYLLDNIYQHFKNKRDFSKL